MPYGVLGGSLSEACADQTANIWRGAGHPTLAIHVCDMFLSSWRFLYLPLILGFFEACCWHLVIYERRLIFSVLPTTR